MNTNKTRVTKLIVLSLSILLLTVLTVSADDAAVSRLNLNSGSGETVLKIDVSGPFQFVHETAEAKDGKPFRVVVDIFPATHELSQKDYTKLPKSMLSSIRTSQYSVNPEKVVRVVCDLDQTVMYRVEKKGNSVYLYLPDKKSGSFASWSSPVKAPVTVASISKETKNEPAKKVVKKKVVRKVTTTPPTAKAPKKEKVTVAKNHQTKSSNFLDYDRFLSAQSSPKKTAQVASKQVASVQAVKSEPVAKKVARKKVVKVDPPKPKAKSSQPVQEFTMTKKTTPVKKEAKKETTMAAPVVKRANTKSKEIASVDLKKKDKAEDKTKPTSRFRRKPTFPAKLKGTIVAEFPTRIVMKYRPGTGRDPFKNLLAGTKGNNSPIQKKIPDVETAKLVGIMESADGKKRALLEDHDGYGYILKSGDKIKKGYVGKIYSDKAYFKLFEYGWSRTVALYMSIN